jgi:hypothetical protein
MTRRQHRTEKATSLGRHEQNCRVCCHEQRAEIEREFTTWRSPAKIASEYGLKNRASIYRHAHALNLFAKRARNIRAALERIIEGVDDIEFVNASAIVAAITAFVKLNSQGQLIERTEQINLNDLFERMTPEELRAYAETGKLPPWFPQETDATSIPDGDKDPNE